MPHSWFSPFHRGFWALISSVFPLVAFSADCDDTFRKVLGSIQSQSSSHPGVEYAKQKASQLIQLKGQGVTEKTITSGMDRQDLIYVYGVPESVKPVNHSGTKVFRHYTKEALPMILSSRELKSGVRPFIDPTPHARWEYQDLTGVMFTTPDVKATDLWMDLNDRADWVEFTLDPEIPVLLCKEGNYLVPLQKNYPDWIRAEYDRFMKSGVANPQLSAEFQKLKSSGGMVPRQGIPIRIKRFSKGGVIQEL